MKLFLVIAFLILSTPFVGRSQFPEMALRNLPEIDSLDNYTECVELADSLYDVYVETPFYVPLNDSIIYDGLAYIRNLNLKALKIEPDGKKAKKQEKKCSLLLDKNFRKDDLAHYNKLLDAASKKMDEGNLDKAFEYYSRARTLMPSDKRPKRALKRISRKRKK